MSHPLLTVFDIPPDVWVHEICRHLDDYARASLLITSRTFRRLLRDLRYPLVKCDVCCGEPHWADIYSAVFAGHMKCVKCILPVAGRHKFPGLTYNAARHGYLDLLRIILSRGYHWDGRETVAAAKGGHDVVLWALKNEWGLEWSGKETYWAARNGYPETLRVLRNELYCPWSGGETHAAAREGEAETLRTLVKDLRCKWSGDEYGVARTEEVRAVLRELGCPAP